MNLLDVIVLAAAVSAAVGGYRLGLLARATSWLGLALGFVVAARFLPEVVDASVQFDPSSRLLLAATVLIGGALLGQALGLVVGGHVHRVLPLGPVRIFDRTAGSALGVAGVVAAVWALLPAMAQVPGWTAHQTANSHVAQAIDSWLPPPPDTLQALSRIIGEDVVPKVFDKLRPSPEVGPAPESTGLSREVLARATTSTVKVEGVACSRVQDGTGFVAAPDVVVTNAHVVAGEEETRVIRNDGRRLRATVTLFDPNRDLAVLRVPNLGRQPLAVGASAEGQTGAVFGHPGGGDLRVAPSRVSQEIKATGRDIYDRNDTSRRVLVLAASLRPGDSGGAMVDPAGAVVGVAFAISRDESGVAYALHTAELQAVLAAPRTRAAATGPCLR
jgi:S1-C subfamily serine protease